MSASSPAQAEAPRSGAAAFRRIDIVATLAGVPLYDSCGYSRGERFEILLAGAPGLPVVRMTKDIHPHS